MNQNLIEIDEQLKQDRFTGPVLVWYSEGGVRNIEISPEPEVVAFVKAVNQAVKQRFDK